MAFRFYLVPAIGRNTAGNINDPQPWTDTTGARRPKYPALDVNGPCGFGFNPVFLCGADLAVAQHDIIAADAQCFAFPADLTATLSGGAITTRKARFEDFFIPGDGVVNGMTEKQCIRYVAGLFQYMQRLHGVLGNEVFIDTLAKLNILWNTVPVNPYQTAVLLAATALGYDTSFIVGTTQVRAILRNFADQWGNETFHFGPFNL
jgi:hypothetical protein